jgi:hypothetical protein
MELTALIGDIVGSRTVSDRNALQHDFLDVLKQANETTAPTTTLRITRGDEFEGSYGSWQHAWEATLRLRLFMLQRGHDLWISVSQGEVTALPNSDEAATQDGPAWWAARAALTDLKTSPRAARNRRTIFTGVDSPPLAAAVILRDEVLAGIDATDATITIGLLDGHSQAEIADGLGITAGVVSRRIHRNGLLSLAESASIRG